MKHQEFYRKYKVRYHAGIAPIFSKRNWWHAVLVTAAAVLVEPLIVFRYLGASPFSFSYYLHRIEYSSLIAIPFGAILFWVNWRESQRQGKGYGWIGKFEVIDKQSSFPFCHLHLAPGEGNKLKVDRGLFDKTRVGDHIVIRRNALGNIEEVSKINNLSGRLLTVGTRRIGT